PAYPRLPLAAPESRTVLGRQFATFTGITQFSSRSAGRSRPADRSGPGADGSGVDADDLVLVRGPHLLRDPEIQEQERALGDRLLRPLPTASAAPPRAPPPPPPPG